jgi:hypothetical protein
MQASVAAFSMNQRESQSCFSPYAPEHNLDTGLVTAILAGDYQHAQWAAEGLRQSQRLFRTTYVSPGTNYAAAIEVALYFGRCSINALICAFAYVKTCYRPRAMQVIVCCRCNELTPIMKQSARGRSSRNGERYVEALHTLHELICIVQRAFSDRRKHLFSGTSTAEQDANVARLVKSLAMHADEVCTASISLSTPRH